MAHAGRKSYSRSSSDLRGLPDATYEIQQSLTNHAYEVVECDEVEQNDGSFTIRASRPFNGRLVLK